MSDEFSMMIKSQTETASIEEVEKALNIRFKFGSKLTSNVKPNDLLVDYSYQRVPSAHRVSEIAKNFNKSAIGVVTLSMRDNGDLYVIDGQHRVEAMKKLNKGNDDINAIVYFELTVKQEAELFVLMNDNRTKPKRGDLHRASSSAGDYNATQIDEVLQKFNLVVGDKPGYGVVRAVGTIHKVFDKIGKSNLEKVIKILIDANGNHSSAFQAEYIEAVSVIVTHFKSADLAKLTGVINRLGNPAMAILKAKGIASSDKALARVQALACMMIDGYNYRLTKYRLDKTIVLSLDARNYLNERGE
jgi:hypothetical protein